MKFQHFTKLKLERGVSKGSYDDMALNKVRKVNLKRKGQAKVPRRHCWHLKHPHLGLGWLSATLALGAPHIGPHG